MEGPARVTKPAGNRGRRMNQVRGLEPKTHLEIWSQSRATVSMWGRPTAGEKPDVPPSCIQTASPNMGEGQNDLREGE
jgi:hypothetical protein